MGRHAGLLIGASGALTIPLNAVAIGAVPVEKSGFASGIFNTAREAGGSLSIAIIGAVLMGSQGAALAEGAKPASAFAAGYSDGLMVAAGLAFVAALIALVTLRTPHEQAPGASQPHPARDTVTPVRQAA